MKFKLSTLLNKDKKYKKYKAIVFGLLLFSTSFFAKAQSVIPDVVNTTGSSNAIGDFFIDFSVGESAVITLPGSSMIITQGFLQPEKADPCVEFDLEFFPNPTADVITIRVNNCPEALSRIDFFDVFGKFLLRTPVRNQRVNLTSLNTGLYLGKVFTLNGTFAGVIKVIKVETTR